MGKIKEIRKLYKEVISEISKSEENWVDFLNCSSWNFKYNFDDQVLIYAQKPNAMACASIDEWNKKLKRWVNKGTTPIYVLDKNPFSQYPFRFVFDVSDTHDYNNNELKLWTVKKEYEKDIIEDLVANFGDIEQTDTFSSAMNSITYNMVIDNIEDYVEDIIKNKANSKLEEFSEDEIRAIVIPTVWASVNYVIMNRCGINAKQEIDIQEFQYIKYFDKQEILTTLGSSVSDIAETGLRQISRTIATLQKNENFKNRTIAKINEEIYSKDNNKIRGGIENDRENRIHETRRLLYAEPNNGERKDSSREIFSNEVQLSNEAQKLRTNESYNEPKIDETFNRDTRTGEQESRKNDRRYEETRWSNRGNEESSSDEVGRTNEQLQNDSGGDSGKRDNLHLKNEENQIQTLQVEAEDAPTFSFSQEMIDSVLQDGSNFQEGKMRIYNQFMQSFSSKENIEFLKQEYGIGGSSSTSAGMRN